MEITAKTGSMPPAHVSAEAGHTVAKEAKPPSGTVVRGEVMSQSRDKITIRMPNGEEVSGKNLTAQQAKVGQQLDFRISYDENGKLQLTAEGGAQQQSPEAVKNALMAMGLKADAENIEILKMLLNNRAELGKGLDKDLFQSFKRAIKLLGGTAEEQSGQKAAFMLKNELDLSSKNARILESCINGNSKISGGLAELIKSLEQLAGTGTQKQVAANLPQDAAKAAVQSEQAATAKTIGADASQAKAAELTSSAKATNSAVIAKGTEAANQEQIRPAQAQDAQKAQAAQTEKLAAQGQEALKTQAAQAAQTAQTSQTSQASQMEKTAAQMDSKAQAMQADGKTALVQDKAVLSFSKDAERILKGAPEFAEQGKEVNTPKDFRAILQEEIIPQLKDRLSFNPKDTNPKDLDDFFTKLLESLETLKTEVHKSQPEGSAKILNDIANIRDNVEFANNLKSAVFMQVPVQINSQQETAQLYVFKDKKSKNKNPSSSSALIALDTVNLGRFEVYVQKKAKQINCQFRLENINIEKQVRTNVHRLNNLLGEYGYTLENYSFKQIEESFTLIDKPPDAKSFEGQNGVAFDIRT